MEDDDDMGALFRSRRVASQEKRATNREASTRLLTERGIKFTEHNHGAHLIVAGAWNFWPGTGRFEQRKGTAGGKKIEGRGVLNLLRHIEQEKARAD